MKTFNRILSVLLVILMMVSIAMMGVVAEEATTVTTADEFAVALQAGGTVTLGADIDFSGFTAYPIEVKDATVVEGNNYTLKNVNVGTAGLLNLAACNSAANKATFKNLKIGTAEVPATAEVGANRGLIYDAAADYEKIYTVWNNVDVWASANIKGGYNFGVFFGTINGGHTFTGCDITLDLRDSTGSGNAVGAFIGRCNSGVGSLVFTNCSTNGYIVNGANVGGYIGKLDNAKAANFTFCVNNADVKNPGGGNGNAAGGFVGLSNDTPVLNYSDCVNNGIVVSPSGKAQTGHFHGTTTVQESATGKTYVPSNTETLTVDGVEYQTIHNSADLGTKLQTAGNHILMQHVDMSGVTAPAVVTDGILLEGYGMSLLGINAPNATDYGIFDLQKNYVSDCTGVTMRNFTVGSVTAPAISRNSVVVSYPTSKTYTDHNHDGNTDKEPVLTSTWENITVYGQLTNPNAHVGAFARYPGGIWTFNNVDVYLEVQTPGNVAVGGFFGRFDGTASFTDCTTNNLSSGVPLQNTGNNAGGFIGKCETGRTLTFTRCVNYANVQGGGSNGNGVGGFLGLNGGSSLTFTDCVNAGNIANANNAAVGAMVGSISSGKETVVSFFNAGTVTSGANKVTAPIEQVVYNGQTYSIDSADKTISVEDKVYTVLAVAKDFEKLANKGNFILFSDVRMGVVKASYDVADGVLLDGNNHSLTDLTLSTEVCLFTFKAGTTSTFMNLTVGSAEDPANAWAAVMTYAYTDEDVDLETNPNGAAQAEAAARRRASVGKFNTDWVNVKIYTTIANTSGNHGAFFAGNVEGTHTFTNCTATVTPKAGQTQQGSQVGAFMGRNKYGIVTFTNCTANGVIGATSNAGGFLGKLDGIVTFIDCENNVETSSANAAGFIGLAESTAKATFQDSTNKGNATGTTNAAGFVAEANGELNFKNSTNSGTITATSHAAGFVAVTAKEARSAITFDACVNEGAVSNAKIVAGFMANTLSSTGIEIFIVNSQNKGEIRTTPSDAQAGGLFGTPSGNIKIVSCINAGSIYAPNQSAGIIVGTDSSTVVIRNTVNRGTVSARTWAAGFVRRAGQVTIDGCINMGAIVGADANSTQFVATQSKDAGANTIVIKNSYAIGTVNDGAVDAPWTCADKLSTLQNNSTEVDKTYNKRFNADGTLRVIKGYQLSTGTTVKEVVPGTGYTDEVYSARLLAGVDFTDYDSVVMRVTMTIEGWSETKDYTIKALYKNLTVSMSNGNILASASDHGANYFAALAIDLLPPGVDATFEITLFVTEHGVTYQLGNSATVTTNGPEDEWTYSFGEEIPKYPDGAMKDATYTRNAAMGERVSSESNYKMFMVTGTTSEAFEAYITSLKNNPACTVTDAGDAIDGVSGYWVETPYTRMYAYMVANRGHAAFILDRVDVQTTNTEFNDGYNYTGSGDITFYLYGLTYDGLGVNIGENYPLSLKTNDDAYDSAVQSMPWIEKGAFNPNFKNCGMMLVVKLADNSVIIIDGGHEAQMSDEAAIELNKFLHDITGKSMDQIVTIKAWYISHHHGDHFNGFIRFLNSFHEYYDMERVMFNMTQGYSGDIRKILDADHALKWYPDLQFHRLHTGETIKLGGAELDIMFTQEDLTYDRLNAETGKIEYKSPVDDNSSSVLLRIRYDGITIMVPADMGSEGEDEVMKMYDASALKADVFQAAHHTWNKLSRFCAASAPTYLLHAQSYGGTQYGLAGDAYNNYNNYLSCMNSSLSAAQKQANNYFGGGTTTQDANGKLWQTTTATGISAKNGVITVNVVHLDTPKPGWNAYKEGENLYGDWSIWSEIDKTTAITADDTQPPAN